MFMVKAIWKIITTTGDSTNIITYLKFQPNQILLGVDPWLLNKHNYQARWKSLSKEYRLAAENIHLTDTKNKILVSSSKNSGYYIHEKILENIYGALNIRNLALTVDHDKDQQSFIMRDGRMVYGKKDRASDINDKIIDYSMYRYEFSNEFFEK